MGCLPSSPEFIASPSMPHSKKLPASLSKKNLTIAQIPEQEFRKNGQDKSDFLQVTFADDS
jgi:hypothetical protein